MTDSDHSRKLAEMAFGDAMGDYRKSDLKKDAAIAPLIESDNTIEGLIGAFEAAAQVDDDANEFWFARDLQSLLEYTKWDNFLQVIAKAKAACEQAGFGCDDHFAGVGKMVSIGSGSEREIDDIVLSRYACYLVAQNADGKKRPVAFAQTYFAIQTRRQEIADQEAQEYVPLSESERRVVLRDEIKTHNKHLASAAKVAGVRWEAPNSPPIFSVQRRQKTNFVVRAFVVRTLLIKLIGKLAGKCGRRFAILVG